MGGWAGGEPVYRTVFSLAQLLCLGKETTHGVLRLRQQEQLWTTKVKVCKIDPDIQGYHQGQHWISVQILVLDSPIM